MPLRVLRFVSERFFKKMRLKKLKNAQKAFKHFLRADILVMSTGVCRDHLWNDSDLNRVKERAGCDWYRSDQSYLAFFL